MFCPFAHRANLVRHLKGLQDIIPISIVQPYPKGDEKGWPGWKFPGSDNDYPGATIDHLFGSEYLHDVYFRADKEYKGRYSVPVLWDKTTQTIVNNESPELMRYLQTAFNRLLPDQEAAVTFYPEHSRAKIDEVAEWMQRDLNTGVYKAGFAQNASQSKEGFAASQESYEKNVIPVFAALNRLEKMVSQNGGPYLLGKELTELDLRLYATLIRFDTVYHYHFKCNLGMIRHDYPQLNNWMKNLYHNVPGFKETTDFKHIKENYTKSHYEINPSAITPLGPYPDVEEGYEPDLGRIRVGGVQMPAVMDAEKRLPG